MPNAPFWEGKSAYTISQYLENDVTFADVLCGEETLRKPEPPHMHEEVEILFILEGRGLLSVNGVDFPVKAGSMAYLFSFHVHCLSPEKGSCLRFYYCRFALSALTYFNFSTQSTKRNMDLLEYADPCQHMDEKSNIIEDIFRELIAEAARLEHDYSVILSSCLMRMIVLFERKAYKESELQHERRRPLAWRILQYIQCHFSKPLDSACIAEKFNVTVMQLNSMLRLLTGMNFSQNLHMARVRNASAMMQFDALGIAFIAMQVGYRSVPAFHKQFKNYKGMTPDEYRLKKCASKSIAPYSFFSEKIWFYINENYQSQITIDSAAKALYLSKSSISGLVNKTYGMSFAQLLIKVRLWLSCGLLLGTGMLVGDIAMFVGFRSLRTFGRCFQEEFETTPVKFRTAGKGNAAANGAGNEE